MSILDPAVAADLVRRIAEGDEAAETELVERAGRTLRFLARRHSRHESDADDLYQEALLLALTKIRRHEVREPENLAGFLRALVKNLAVGRYRRKGVVAEQGVDHLDETAAEHRPGPLSGLLDRERAGRTRKLLSELDVPRDRAILFRYYLAEEPSPTICDDLGIDRDHFYRVLHRARRRYRKLWETSTASDTRGGPP